MPLEDFTGSNSTSTSSSSDYPHHLVEESWTTSLDYSRPYILVAEDRSGELYIHQGRAVIMYEHTDWRRMEDHPDIELREVYRCATERDWLRFCNRAQSQLDTDPRVVLDESPRDIEELRERVYYPPASKPDTSRECSVCGAGSHMEDVTMLDIDLHTQRRVPVCSTHTVDDLACSGLLE